MAEVLFTILQSDCLGVERSAESSTATKKGGTMLEKIHEILNQLERAVEQDTWAVIVTALIVFVIAYIVADFIMNHERW